MAAPRKKSTGRGIGRLTEEFTSGQLVIGMVVCLLVVLCGFLVGILVGKLDPSLHQEKTAATPGTQEATMPPPVRSREQQALPSPRPAAPAKDVRPYTRPNERTNEPRRTRLKPPPPVKTPPKKPTAPLKATKKETPTVPKKTAPVPPKRTKPPAAPAVESTSPAPTPTPKRDEVVPLRGWVIQLAAFSGDKRQEDAEAYRRRLRDNAGLRARILHEKSWCKVVLVGYNDEAAAKAACAVLKKKPSFEEAWVRKLP